MLWSRVSRERPLHPFADALYGINPILAVEEIMAPSVDKTHHREVSRRFLVFLQEFRIAASLVVVDEQGNELRFNALHEAWVAEDLGPEVTAALSSRDFLEEKKDGLTGFSG